MSIPTEDGTRRRGGVELRAPCQHPYRPARQTTTTSPNMSGQAVQGGLPPGTNKASISGITLKGVVLDGGGSLNNRLNGFVSGGVEGVLVEGAAGTVTNTGCPGRRRTWRWRPRGQPGGRIDFRRPERRRARCRRHHHQPGRGVVDCRRAGRRPGGQCGHVHQQRPDQCDQRRRHSRPCWRECDQSAGRCDHRRLCRLCSPMARARTMERSRAAFTMFSSAPVRSQGLASPNWACDPPSGSARTAKDGRRGRQ
jgi:hypothetical protein